MLLCTVLAEPSNNQVEWGSGEWWGDRQTTCTKSVCAEVVAGSELVLLTPPPCPLLCVVVIGGHVPHMHSLKYS